MCAKDVFHDLNKVLLNVYHQSIRVSHCNRPSGCSGTIYNICLFVNIKYIFLVL